MVTDRAHRSGKPCESLPILRCEHVPPCWALASVFQPIRQGKMPHCQCWTWPMYKVLDRLLGWRRWRRESAVAATACAGGRECGLIFHLRNNWWWEIIFSWGTSPTLGLFRDTGQMRSDAATVSARLRSGGEDLKGDSPAFIILSWIWDALLVLIPI